MNNILSWNIAGIRSSLKRTDFEFLKEAEYDIVCIQETKADEDKVVLPNYIKELFPFRYWENNQGITQRKGFSGTCIWSKVEGNKLNPPEIDKEGRVTAVEFNDYILVNVYTPNSQSGDSERFKYRSEVWDDVFRDYIQNLNSKKCTIVCGDLNVAHKDIDVYEPSRKIGRAGFLEQEKIGFQKHLDIGYLDAFRFKCDKEGQYTYWDQRFPHLRRNNKGWRIDYFIVPEKNKNSIVSCDIHKEILGSDHCPISLCVNFQ